MRFRIFVRGYNGIVCTEEERSINFQDYYETILSEDLPAVNTWMEANRRELLKEYIEYRILLEGQVYYMLSASSGESNLSSTPCGQRDTGAS